MRRPGRGGPHRSHSRARRVEPAGPATGARTLSPPRPRPPHRPDGLPGGLPIRHASPTPHTPRTRPKRHHNPLPATRARRQAQGDHGRATGGTPHASPPPDARHPRAPAPRPSPAAPEGRHAMTPGERHVTVPHHRAGPHPLLCRVSMSASGRSPRAVRTGVRREVRRGRHSGEVPLPHRADPPTDDQPRPGAVELTSPQEGVAGRRHDHPAGWSQGDFGRRIDLTSAGNPAVICCITFEHVDSWVISVWDRCTRSRWCPLPLTAWRRSDAIFPPHHAPSPAYARRSSP